MSDLSILVAKFDAVVTLRGEPPPRPTAFSLQKIERHFGFIVPPALVWFARNSKSFGGWFASLGPDYDSPSHIIRINSHWRRRRRTRRIPEHLVAFNLGFDGDLDCFDLQNGRESAEYPVVYWSPGIGDPKPYPSFVAYIEDYIRGWEAK